MVVKDVASEVEFLRTVFDATRDIHPERPAEIRIGNSIVLISRAGDRELFPAFLYVYVDDADAFMSARLPPVQSAWNRLLILRMAIGGRWCATFRATSSRSRTDPERPHRR
jgi:hypothetical protein